MSGFSLRQRADRLRAIPLERVLEVWGAQRDRYDPHKWHTSQGVLSLTGAKFMNWHCGRGGGGAIDLVIQLTHRGFAEALRWLERSFPAPASPTSAPSLTLSALQLPAPDPSQLERVKHYLITQRGLPPALLELLVQSGSLYADAQANVVFLLRDPQSRPVGAELRGSTRIPWRGMAPGSRKDRGYFAIPATPLLALILCESAIDALSCFVLHPQHRCLSTAGARPNPRWLAPLLEQGYRVYCGFDADPTGEAMAQAMIALHPAVQRLRPTHKDWNDVLCSRR
jgi:hypothetical protein